MNWPIEKKQQIVNRKLHHRNYKRALSQLQTEMAFSDRGEVITFTGPSRAGKSSILKRLEREYQESAGVCQMTEHPFVYVEVKNQAPEGRFNSKAFFAQLADALHHPAFSAEFDEGRHREVNVARTDRRTTADLMTACERALRHLNSRILAIDEAQHIEWHGSSPHARTAILDSFKSFASGAGVTLVLAGAYPIVRMLRASSHMVGRSSLVEIPRYLATPEDADEFMNVLDWYSKGITFERGVRSLVDWAEYIHEHSLGVIGLVGRWLRIAMARMVDDDSDRLAWKYMELARRSDADLQSIAAEIELGDELLEKRPVEEPVCWVKRAAERSPKAKAVKKKRTSKKAKKKSLQLKPFEIKNRPFKKKLNK